MTAVENNIPNDQTSVSETRASSPSSAAPAPPTQGSNNPTATSSSPPNNNAPTGDTNHQGAETAAIETNGSSSFEIERQAVVLEPNPLVAISAAISSSEGPRSRRSRRYRHRRSRRISSNGRNPRSPLSEMCSQCSKQLCLLLIYPGIVVMTIIGLIVVFFFCVLPTMMCLCIGICVYYCFHSDPVPLPILIRRLFEGREDIRATQSRVDRFDPNSERVKALRAMYRSKLIVRKVLRVQTINDAGESELDSLGFPQTQDHDEETAKNHNDESILTIDQRSNISTTKIGTVHKEEIDENLIRNYNLPIRIRTDHSILYLSAPIKETADASDEENEPTKESREIAAGDTDDTDSNDNENDANFPGFVPHYQRSFDSDAVGDATEIQADSDTSSNYFSVDQKTEDDGENSECKDTEKGDGERIEKCSLGHLRPEEESICFGDAVRDLGTVCDICMLESEVGDEIAWSPNLSCKHSFHNDCILDWLVRKPTCPCCRQNYLDSSADDNV